MPDFVPRTTVDPASPYVILEARRRRRDRGSQIAGDRIIGEVRYKDTARHTSDRLLFTLDNADGLILSDELLMSKGTLIRLKFGYPGYDRDAGDFVLKKRKPSGLNMTFECHEAKRNKASRKLNTRQWTEVRRSDVVRQVLQRMGYSGGFLEVDTSELVLPIIIQMREGDYQFIERLADEEAKEFWIDADGAHWIEPARNKKPSRKIRYPKGLLVVGNVIGDPMIEDFGANAPGRITLHGIDPLTGEEFTVRSSDSTDPNERVKGLVKLNETDELMTPDEGDEEASGNDGFEIVDNTGARSREEAKLEADTLYKEYRYGALKVKIPVIMDPHLRPRRTVEVLGLGPAVDGKFYVKEVNHSISAEAFATSVVELNKDGLNKKRRAKSDLRVNRNQGDPQRGAA